MDGLQRVAASDNEITLKGVSYRTSPMTVGMWGEIEAHIGSGRATATIESIASALPRIPKQYHAAWIEAAAARAEKSRQVSSLDVTEFLRSYDGAAFLLWALLRKHNPQFKSHEDVKALIDDTPLVEIQAKLDAASGMNDLKKSAGPGEQVNQETTAASPGPSSFAT